MRFRKALLLPDRMLALSLHTSGDVGNYAVMTSILDLRRASLNSAGARLSVINRWTPGERPMRETLLRPNLLKSATTLTSFEISHHQAIELGLQHVGSGWPDFEVETIDGQKQPIGVKFPEHRLRLRSHEGARHGTKQPTDHDHGNVGGIHQLAWQCLARA